MKKIILIIVLSLNVFAEKTLFETCVETTRAGLQAKVDQANATRVDGYYDYILTRTTGPFESTSYSSTFLQFAIVSSLSPNPPHWAWMYSCENRTYKDTNYSSTATIASTVQKNSLPPWAQNTPIACGSIINYDKGTVLESVPISGTNLELVYNSNYNANLDNNRRVEVSYSILLDRGYDTKIRLTNNSDIELDTKYYSGLFNYVNYSKSANFPEALVENTNFISNYMFKINLDRSVVIATPNEENPDLAAQHWIPSNYGDEKTILIYKPEAWGLAGWTISEHHYFHKTSKTLFTGDGQIINYEEFKSINLQPYGNVDVLADLNSGEQIYIFDQQGRHLETRDTTWNKPIFKFFYNGDKIAKISDRFGLETVFNYDVGNKITSINSPYGLQTIITINNGNIEKITNPLSQEYLMSYGAKKELLTYKNINDVTTTFVYSADGFLQQEQKTSGILQSFTNDFTGVAKNLHHKLNNYFKSHKKTELPSESYTREDSGPGFYISDYDSENRLISKETVYPVFRRKEVSVGEESLVLQYNQSRVWSSNFVKENLSNRKISSLVEFNENFSENDTWYTISDSDLSAQGGRVKRISVGNKLWTTIYSATNKTVTYTDSENNQTIIYVNDIGQPVQINSRNKPIKYLSYDSQFRLIKTQEGTQFESYSYDQYGNISSITNSKGQTTSFQRNPLGMLLKKTLPNGDNIVFEYTSTNALKKMILPNGEAHNFTYSIGDYLASYLTPGNKSTFYDYDSDKRISKITKPSGKIVKYNYKVNSANIDSIETDVGIRKYAQIDEQGRIRDLKSEDGIRLEVSWAAGQVKEQKWYDSDGSLIASLSNGFRKDMLKVNSISLNGVEFANYSSGDISSASLINNKINCFRYANSLSLNCSGGGFGNDFIIDKSTDDNLSIIKTRFGRSIGQIGGAYEGHTVELSRSINFFGEVESAEDKQTVRVDYAAFDGDYYDKIKKLTPNYDANSRMISVSNQNKVISNNNNILNESLENSYLYPQGSNNNVKEYKSNSKRTIATHNSEDQLIKLTGSVNKDYQYTADGDLKSYTNCNGTTNFEYDVFGNLKKVVLANGKVIEYKVDGLNRRVKKIVNGQVKEYYLWHDQIHLAAVLDENKQAKVKFIYTIDSHSASIIEKEGQLYKIVHDPGLGSIRYVVNVDTKEVVQEIEYDELGNMIYNSNKDFQPLGYAGGLFDSDTGLTRFFSRDYDSSIGRWTTKDSIGLAGGLNQYVYVEGNPMSYIDPNGEFPLPLIFGALAGIFYGTDTDTPGAATDEMINVPLSVLGGTGIGKSCNMATKGSEIAVSKKFRIAPFGNRTGHPTGQFPHYHRSVPNPQKAGESLANQGIRRHRPWDKLPGDKTFWDRF